MRLEIMIKWTTSKKEMEIESAIAKRTMAMATQANVQYDQMTAIMDIDACHRLA